MIISDPCHLVLVCFQQAFNATAVVRHMRRLQLGTSLEGSSQITTTSPCHRHLLLPAKEHHLEEDEDNEEEEIGEIAHDLSNRSSKRCGQLYLIVPLDVERSVRQLTAEKKQCCGPGD